MKQTPIPEKIKQYDICHEKDVLGIGYVYELDKDKILNLFNSLIDVLTEHEKHMTKQFAENRAVYERMNKMQKEIEELKKAYTHHIKAEHIGYDPKPYTAMRSTGVKEEDLICRPHGMVKPYIKPQEDVEKQIQQAVYEWTENHIHNWKNFDLSKRILAIVKGE